MCVPTRAELSERLAGNPYTISYTGGGADGSVGDGPGRGEGGSRGSGGNGSGGSGSGDGNGEGIVIGAPSVAGCSTISVRRRQASDQTGQQLTTRAAEAGGPFSRSDPLTAAPAAPDARSLVPGGWPLP